MPNAADNKAARLLKRIKSTFPELSWTDYRYIDEGWDHEVIILDNRFVFRFPDDEEYLALLEKEIEILGRLKPLLTVRIPEYAYFAPDHSFAGYPMVPGKVFDKKLFDGLPPATRTEIAKQMAGFLTTLHTLEKNGHTFTKQVRSYMSEDQEQVKKEAELHLKGILDERDFGYVQEMLADVDELLSREQPVVFTHGDLYHSHILWDEDAQRLGVIDFSDMVRGDPAIDFAESFEYGEDFIREIYGYYEGPKDDTFLERAWTYQRWVGVFMMTDHFINEKIPFKESREIFDRTKSRRHLA